MLPSYVPGAHPTALNGTDQTLLQAQLGRPARGAVAVAARCLCLAPVVVVSAPLLPDGTPFPTTYYLTLPPATAAISELESQGRMAQLSERLQQDEKFAAAYAAAHEAFLADRSQLAAGLGQSQLHINGISAGGMPNRIKCLHALAAHALAAGPGVNPVGDIALAEVNHRWRIDQCRCVHRPQPWE